MKKLKLFFALFAMLALGVGNAWAQDVIYTLDGTKTGGSNGYAEASTITQNSISWSVVGNTTMNPWRIGGKSLTNVDRTIASTNAISSGVSKIVVTHGTASNITVNSLKLIVASDKNFANVVSTITGTFKASNSTTFECPNGADWTNMFYKLVYNVTVSGNSNSFVQFKSAEFYEAEPQVGDDIIVKTLKSIAVAGMTTTYEQDDIFKFDGTCTATYSVTTNDVAQDDETKTVTPTVSTPDMNQVGTQTITVSYTEDGNTVTTTYDINVTANEVTPGTYTGTLNNVFFGCAVGNNAAEQSGKFDDVLVVAGCKSSASSKTNYQSGHVRFYADSYLTISVPAGYVIKSIVFTADGTWSGSITASAGTYDNNSKTWAGNAQEVKFSFAAQNRIKSVKVTYVADVKYALNITAPTNGTISVKNGSSVLTDGAQVYEGTKLVVTPTPATGYVFESLTVDGSAVELTDGTYTFNMPAADVTIAATFKENEKSPATLTLSKNGVTEDITGYKQDDKVILPSITSDCVKEFVGWSVDPNCTTEPEYKDGDEYTLAATAQTLYAVYADEKESTTTEEYTFTSFSSAQEVTLGSTSFRVKLQKGTGSTNPAWHSGSAEARIYAKGLLTIVASKPIVKVVYTYAINKNSSGKQPTIDGVAGKNNAGTWDAATKTWNGSDTEIILSTSGDAGNVGFKKIVVTLGSIGFENYSTTCAAAPKAEVNPTTVSATAAGANDKVEVTYENVNTANVAVALYNDAACTEAFTADWLTASLDGDKNIAYTVAATTLYTERKAYIKLTAPETTGATEPAVVVIPVTQAGKDKVFASLEELVAAITPTMAGIEVTVTLTNEVIQDFYTSGSYTNGIALNVPYEGGVKVIEIYCKNVPAEWVKGGKVSGTITCPWKLYNSTWELCPTAWTELTYTAPATVSSIAVSGNPTKTTYIDGEKFDPAGLVVTATYSDASTGAIDAALVDWTFDPATLVKGQTSVNVTAKFNSVSSAAYEVTGLTVNDIPTKTVAEFIAAGGTRCYLEGIVSGLTEGNSMKYGNFDLTDASGKIYVYGCLNAAGESQKFADLGVKNGDKIKVIADEYELYGGTKQEAKNVQYVSHVSAATITIADITMEVGETKTIAATVVPAEAEVTYTIKENAANAISLSGNTITANAVGTATITATVAEGATYMGNSVDFTVKVTPKTNKVVILAEREGQWYALKAEYLSGKTDRLVAIPVDYFNGTLYNVAEEVKATIEWNSIVEGDKVSFLNDGKYLKGKTSTTLIFEAGEEGLYQWNKDDYTMVIGTTERTFLYNGEAFRNFATSNAGQIKDGITYSSLPVVTAPIYVNLNTSSVKTVEKGIFSVADGKFVQFSTGNLQYEVEYNKWSFAENQYDYVGEANINVGNPNYEGKIDMFGWSADGKFGVNPSNKNEDYYGTFQDWGDLVNEADWYTLSADEWKYLLNTRANAANLKQIAKVNNGEKDIVGIMLFPDAWAMPADVNVAAAYDDYFKVNIYNYTLEQWQKLEAVGAVFLPAAGRRTGGWGNTTISPHMVGVVELDSDGHYKYYDNGNIYCYYWTSTINESNDVSYLHNIQALGGDEYTIGTGAVWGEKGRYGQSVRLVKAIEPDYKREVRQGYYGTICLGNGGQMIGASLFGLSYYNEAQGLLYMDEEGTVMTAGNPYIFLPNEGADSLYVFYDETTAIEAGTVNGLVGSFESKPLDADGTNYIMKDNKIMKVVGEYASVGAYKAYIKLGDVSKNEPAPVPGRRRVAIGQAPQVATGMESVDASAQPVKMIIDGQLYILRGEKMYDAQGKLVK